MELSSAYFEWLCSLCCSPCHSQCEKECCHSSHCVTISVVCARFRQDRHLSRGSGFHIDTGILLGKGCGAVTWADEHRRGSCGPSCCVFTRGSLEPAGAALASMDLILAAFCQCGGRRPRRQGIIDDIAQCDGVHAGSDQPSIRCATAEAEEGKACKTVSNAVRPASQSLVPQNMAAWDSKRRREE